MSAVEEWVNLWLNDYDISLNQICSEVNCNGFIMKRKDSKKDLIKITEIDLENAVLKIRVINSEFDRKGYTISYDIDDFTWRKYKPANKHLKQENKIKKLT